MTILLAISGLTEDESGNRGSASAGKDAVADIIVRNYKSVRVGLADPMKRFCKEIYKFTDEQLWGPSEARNAPDKRYPREHTFKVPSGNTGTHPRLVCACCGHLKDLSEPNQCYLTPRHALQILGTEWGRDNYEFTWVLPLLETMRLLTLGDRFYSKASGVSLCHASHEGMYPAPKFVVVSDIRFPATTIHLKEKGALNIRVKRKISTLDVGSQHRSETALLDTPDSAFDHIIENYGSLEDLEKTLGTLIDGTHIKGIGRS